jgi:hypothetical protein
MQSIMTDLDSDCKKKESERGAKIQLTSPMSFDTMGGIFINNSIISSWDFVVA